MSSIPRATPSSKSPSLASGGPVRRPPPQHARSVPRSAPGAALSTSQPSTSPIAKPHVAEPAPKRPSPPKHSESTQDYLEIDAFHKAEAMGPKSWSKKSRQILYKAFLLFALLLPLAPSIALIIFLSNHPYFGGNLYLFVTNERSTTQVIVTLFSAILSFFNVFVISNLLKACGIRLAENKVFIWLLDNAGVGEDDDDEEKKKNSKKDDEQLSKEVTKLWKTGVTFKALLVGVLCFGLLSAPHVIWVGALTPIEASQLIPGGWEAYVPQYNPQSESNWSNNTKTNFGCSVNFANSRDFSGCATNSISSALFGALKTAPYLSDISYTGSIHDKNDASDYSYIGRSYGVGSSIGLSSNQTNLDTVDLTRYSFIETGYNTTVQCTRNLSSAWVLETLQPSDRSEVPSVYRAAGRFPNSDWSSDTNDTSASVVAQNIDDVLVWGIKSTDNQHVLAIAAGTTYGYLNQTQCSITFEPTAFNVTAYVKDLKLINVTSAFNSDGSKKAPGAFDDHQGLALTASAQLAILSSLQSSPYTSRLGANLAYSTRQRAYLNSLSVGTLDSNLSAVAMSVAAVIDDILVYVGSSQYYLDSGNAKTTIEADKTVARIQLGKNAYVWLAILCTSLLVVLVIGKEVYLDVTGKKRFWPTNRPVPAGKAELVDETELEKNFSMESGKSASTPMITHVI